MKILITSIILLICIPAFSQQTSLSDLNLICFEGAKYKANGKTNKRFAISKYTFENGKFKNRSIISEFDEELFHFQWHLDTIHKDRYLITEHFGKIFDLKEEKIIHYRLNYDWIADIKGDSIIYKKRKTYSSDYNSVEDSLLHSKINTLYYYFDLRTNQIVPIDKGDQYRVKGVLSPNKKMGLDYVRKSGQGHKEIVTVNNDTQNIWINYGDLYLRRSPNDSILLFENLRISQYTHASVKPEFPVYWINDSLFISQKMNGQFFVSNLKGEMEFFPEIRDIELYSYSPKIDLQNGRIICSAWFVNLYELDLNNMQTYPFIDDHEIGNGYKYRGDWKAKKYYYSYKNKNLQYHLKFTEYHAVKNEFIAITAKRGCIKKKNRGCKSLVLIYDANTQKWIKTSSRNGPRVIGWIKSNSLSE